MTYTGIEAEYANGLYDYIRTTVPTNGYETERRCGLNDRLHFLLWIEKIIIFYLLNIYVNFFLWNIKIDIIYFFINVFIIEFITYLINTLSLNILVYYTYIYMGNIGSSPIIEKHI